jgi:ubiquinone/menaquinone biosynthesis C-methylase UbiE
MFSDPQKNVEVLGLLPGMKVADFGAGSGFYSITLGKIVGGSGRVYAIDIQKDLLTKLQNEARAKGVLSLEIIWGDVEVLGGTKIREQSLDAVVIANLLFQVEKKDIVLKEALRVLNPHGKLLFVEWSDSFGGLGPRPQDIVTESGAVSMFESIGFKKVRSFSAGAHHYGLIFEKK